MLVNMSFEKLKSLLAIFNKEWKVKHKDSSVNRSIYMIKMVKYNKTILGVLNF